MKKWIALLLCMILVLGLAGCGSTKTADRSKKNTTKTVDDVLEEGTQETDDAKDDTDQAAEEYKEEMEEAKQTMTETKGVDIDLTKLNKTMVYSEVANMTMIPEEYKGKIVQMKGQCMTFKDPETQKYYYTCFIKDAQACCQQGIEFELTSNYKAPDDYPEEGANITVVGRFDTYMEEDTMFCTLRDAKLL